MGTTRKQVFTGTVVSTKMQKTVVVQVETLKQHPDFKKYVRRRTRYKVHDEHGKCDLGDVVRCIEVRPISKDKCWRVEQIIRKKYTSTDTIQESDELVPTKEKPAKAEKAEAVVAEAAAEGTDSE